MVTKCVLVNGNYISLEEHLKKKPDIVTPDIISVKPGPAEKATQHIHEMTFNEMRRFCKDNGIKYKLNNTKKDLIQLIMDFHESEDV